MLKGFSHNTSHVSDPMPAAAGIAVLDVVSGERLVDRAGSLGRRLREGLSELQARHECIGDVRGRGLLAGLELVDDRDTRAPALGLATLIWRECLARGLAIHAIPTGPRAHCFRIAPPLTVSEGQLDAGLTILDESIGTVVRRYCSPAQRLAAVS